VTHRPTLTEPHNEAAFACRNSESAVEAPRMPTVDTDVLVIGSGRAGSAGGRA
jgi:hypothetical protein